MNDGRQRAHLIWVCRQPGKPDVALSTRKRGVPIDAYDQCDQLCIILMKEEIQKQIIVGAVDGGDNCRDSARVRAMVAAGPAKQYEVPAARGRCACTSAGHRWDKCGRRVEGCGETRRSVPAVLTLSTGRSTAAVDGVTWPPHQSAGCPPKSPISIHRSRGPPAASVASSTRLRWRVRTATRRA
jgi:hypothetical protein